MDKKGFEMQFNWIFVLVAGTAILLLFSSIILKQKSISDTTTKAAILKNVESIIASNSAREGITTSTDIPLSTIEISCNKITSGKVSKQFSSLILFSPLKITGTKLLATSKEFSSPYKAVNMLFMSSPNVKYIIIGDDNLAREINKSISDKWNKGFFTAMPEIKYEKDTKYRLIFVNIPEGSFPASIQGMPDDDVTALKVQGDDAKGTLTFYSKNRASWKENGKSNYITKNLLIGAVFSGSNENYDCAAANVFSRLALVSGINSDRAGKLLAQTVNSECVLAYQSSKDSFDKIKTSSALISEKRQILTNELNKISIESASLEENNQKLKIRSCPLVY